MKPNMLLNGFGRMGKLHFLVPYKITIDDVLIKPIDLDLWKCLKLYNSKQNIIYVGERNL